MQKKFLDNYRGELGAVQLRSGRYVIRPKGALGTIGWSPVPWEAYTLTATQGQRALQRGSIDGNPLTLDP